jgi:hypothetical protein
VLQRANVPQQNMTGRLTLLFIHCEPVLLWLQSDDLQLTVQQRPTHFDDVSEFLAIWQVSLSILQMRAQLY